MSGSRTKGYRVGERAPATAGEKRQPGLRNSFSTYGCTLGTDRIGSVVRRHCGSVGTTSSPRRDRILGTLSLSSGGSRACSLSPLRPLSPEGLSVLLRSPV